MASDEPARLGHLTSPQVGASRWTLLLPVGSTEQHGPHLPLDTDTCIAREVATRVAMGVPAVVVGPAIAIGAAGEHAGFAGTLSIGSSVLTDTLVEIVRTAGPEFEQIVAINAHGGNGGALDDAVATCTYEGRPLVAWSARLADSDAHAGRTETSVMLAISPGRVDLSRAEPGQRAPLVELISDLRRGGVKSVSANGILGDPTGATAAEGETILAGWVDEVIATLQR